MNINNEFNKLEKRANKTFKLAMVMNIVGFIFILSLIIGIVYVIAHFLGKVW